MALTANTVLSSTATSKFLSLISHFFPNRYVFSPGPTIAMFWYLRFQNSISSHYPPSKNLSFPGGRSRCSASGIVPLPSSSIDDWASRSLVKWLISVKPPWDFWDHECTINDNLDITYIPMLMIENGRRFLCFVVIYIYIQYTYVHTQTIWLVTFWVYFISTRVFGTHLPWRSLSFFLVYQVYPKFQCPHCFVTSYGPKWTAVALGYTSQRLVASCLRISSTSLIKWRISCWSRAWRLVRPGRGNMFPMFGDFGACISVHNPLVPHILHCFDAERMGLKFGKLQNFWNHGSCLWAMVLLDLWQRGISSRE